MTSLLMLLNPMIVMIVMIVMLSMTDQRTMPVTGRNLETKTGVAEMRLNCRRRVQ